MEYTSVLNSKKKWYVSSQKEKSLLVNWRTVVVCTFYGVFTGSSELKYDTFIIRPAQVFKQLTGLSLTHLQLSVSEPWSLHWCVCVGGGGVVKQLAVPWRITLTISCIVGRLLFLCQWQKNVFCERASTFFFIHLFPFGWEKFGWRFSTLFSNPGRLQGNNHFSWN